MREVPDDQTMKAILDVASAGTIVASIVGWLPAVAAVMGILWYGIQIWESKTIQSIFRKNVKPPEKVASNEKLPENLPD